MTWAPGLYSQLFVPRLYVYYLFPFFPFSFLFSIPYSFFLLALAVICGFYV
jgi:hypothetical protein